MPKFRTWQWAVIAVAALVGIILLSGCDGGPKCVSGHYEQQWRYTVEPGFNMTNGMKYDVQPGMKYVNTFVCDEYVPEPASS